MLETLGRIPAGQATIGGSSCAPPEYVAASLALCLLIGYPVAYYISRHAGRTKSLLVALLVLPFWVSYLMRMLAWVNLLAPERLRRTTSSPGRSLVTTPPDWLNGNPFSVILGLVYGYIPYLIMPLLASLDRIDKSLLEAARDLGASPFRAFLHVTLPLSKTGMLGASVIIALPMFGDYYTPNIVSGSPKTSMLGNQIDIYFHGGPQPAIGAALTLVLSAFLGVLMVYYMYTVAKASAGGPAMTRPRASRRRRGDRSALRRRATGSPIPGAGRASWCWSPGSISLVDRAGHHRDPVLLQSGRSVTAWQGFSLTRWYFERSRSIRSGMIRRCSGA